MERIKRKRSCRRRRPAVGARRDAAKAQVRHVLAGRVRRGALRLPRRVSYPRARPSAQMYIMAVTHTSRSARWPILDVARRPVSTRRPGTTSATSARSKATRSSGATSDDDDDELIVRASAVLKSQGRRKLVPRETRSPLGGAYSRALFGTHHAGKSVGKNANGGGVTWRHRSGVRVMVRVGMMADES